MIAKLIVEGKEFDIEILDPKLQELVAPKKKTGYERVNIGQTFYSVRADGTVFEPIENHGITHDLYYSIANYYSSAEVAEDNARADELMHQLRRFAAEHNTTRWDSESKKYLIYYDYYYKALNISFGGSGHRVYGSIYFDHMDDAKLAIETFRDELIWYFTEYKDSL